MRRTLETAKHWLAPLTANCRDFHEHWQAAAAPARDGDMSGRWHGEWISAATGHRGPLRCVIHTISDQRWFARFHAGYAKIFRACYGADLHVAQLGPDRYTFSGNSDLGWAAGGVYEYDGQGTGAELVCRYRSRMDHGEFRLRRTP